MNESVQIRSDGISTKIRDVSGFTLTELTYSPNSLVSTHAHDRAIFCMAIEGGCAEVYATKRREYVPFTLGFLPPHQVHSLRSSSQGMRAFSIDIAPAWLERMREYSLPVEDSVHCPSGILIQLQTKLYFEFQSIDAASPLAVEGLALEMLAEVSRHQEVIKKDRQPPRWLKQARDLIEANFSSPLSLDPIAREVGVHPVHLARVFRGHYHCSIGEYVRKTRIEAACRRLLTSETPLLEIALASGFADQSHFTRTFKRFKGLTPAQYRAKISAAR